jgi:hypothetical protein
MSIEGRIAVDVGFSDSTSASGVQSLKRIALTSTDSYSSGKVAVISGTASTQAVTIPVNPSTFRNANGAIVSFTSSISRVAFKSSGPAAVSDPSSDTVVPCDGNSVSVFSLEGNQGEDLRVQATSGTVSYTIVIYGT